MGYDPNRKILCDVSPFIGFNGVEYIQCRTCKQMRTDCGFKLCSECFEKEYGILFKVPITTPFPAEDLKCHA